MKRKLEEDSFNFIGRSAAERKVDKIYYRQKRELANLKPKQQKSSLLNFKKVLPFPEVAKTEDVKEEPKVKPEPVQRTMKEVLADLGKKHLRSRTKFAKSVSLLAKLANAHFRDSSPADPGVSHTDFFALFATVNEVFVNEFTGDISKDLLDEKEALTALTGVVDHLLDGHRTSSSVKEEPSGVKREEGSSDSSPAEPNGLHLSEEEVLFLKMLKLSFGYSAALWYENDSFAFHKVVNELKRFFEDFIEQTGGTLVPNGLAKVSTDPFQLPSKDELLSLQLRALVRTLGVVFSFFKFTWSRSSLVPFFHELYLKRDVFEESDRLRITSWQSQIKSNRKAGDKPLTVRGIGESAFEVQDAREERVSSTHGSQVWSDRQLNL